MKLKEVPKDDANVLEGKTSFIQYAVNENGEYVQEKSPGFEPQNVVLEQAWEDVNDNIMRALGKVSNGSKSPLYFFMHREIMDLKILAEYMHLPKWRVRRHMKPKVFRKLDKQIIEEYAKALGIEDVMELVQFEAEKWR